MTPAGCLAAEVVIHEVGRSTATGGRAAPSSKRRSAARWPVPARSTAASIAFPALGTGVGGFPIDEAARVTIDAVRDELNDSPGIEHVVFALRGATAYAAFSRALQLQAETTGGAV